MLSAYKDWREQAFTYYTQTMAVSVSCFRVLTTAVLAASLSFFAPAAVAQPGGVHYVAFGDSIAANPTWAEQFQKQNRASCIGGADSYPERLAGSFPSFFNASCAGSKITMLEGEQKPLSEVFDQGIDRAQKHAALGPNTKVVTITIGANDPWPHAMNYGYGSSDISIDANDYTARIRDRIHRIKTAAPNARILLVGYPEFVDDDNRLCLVNHDGGSSSLQLPTIDPTLKNYFHSLNRAMAGAAPKLGVEYVDVATAFRGHNSCASGADRWVTTVIDNPGVSLLPMHISSDGVKSQARIIREHLGY